MPFAKKKPVRVEFMQFVSGDRGHTRVLEMWGGMKDGAAEDQSDALIWAYTADVTVAGVADPIQITVLKVKTLEGWVIAQQGDYIIKGAEAKEFWPVRRDIFEKTYDVEQTQTPRGAQAPGTSSGRDNY